MGGDEESTTGEVLNTVLAAVVAVDEQIRCLADQLTEAVGALLDRFDQFEAESSEHRLAMEALFADMPKDDDFEERVDEIMEWVDALEL